MKFEILLSIIDKKENNEIYNKRILQLMQL